MQYNKLCDLTRKIVRNFTFRTLRHFRYSPNLRAPEVDKYAHGLTLGFSRQISKCTSRLSYLTISVELAILHTNLFFHFLFGNQEYGDIVSLDQSGLDIEISLPFRIL